jgi:hypothetical protein
MKPEVLRDAVASRPTAAAGCGKMPAATKPAATRSFGSLLIRDKRGTKNG